MNKFSVRKQIEKLREDFNAHIEEGSIPPKVRKINKFPLHSSGSHRSCFFGKEDS